MRLGIALAIQAIATFLVGGGGPPPPIEDGTQLDFSNSANSGHVVTAGM